MFLTIFYMIATWVQSWRLSSLRTRLQSILFGSEATRPSIMLYTSNQLLEKDESNDDNNICKNLLSSHLCSNSIDAKLGDLLWYQGDKWLCTIYPQQKVDVSNWLLYPHGKTIFPLFSHNNTQSNLLQEIKMHVLIEADLFYIPQASSKATKLEDYGSILTWMTDNIFGVILETDLDHITKFSTTLMQGQCFINNGLPVTRIESVSVSGKPCICNYEKFNSLESSKIIGHSQWLSYVQKLKEVSNTARLVSQEHKSMKIKQIPGLEISPGDKEITLESPAIAEIALKNHIIENEIVENHASSSVITSPLKENLPKTMTNNKIICQNLNKSIDSVAILNSPKKLSESTSPKVQTLTLQASSQQNLQKSSIAFSSSSISEKNEIRFSNDTKRPNIFICADSTIVNDNVCAVLQTTLKKNKYAIYPLSMEDAKKDAWMAQTNLIIVCGNVEPDVASQVVEYIVHGGKLLALCSDILKIFIPAFKTAEIRENELVRFSYGKWKSVTMLHHIFCYQASPVKTKFSQDGEDSKRSHSPIPVTANIFDQSGIEHSFDLEILGSEETWQTPCILLAKQLGNGGQAVFSQIHLEVDPFQYEFEESKFIALKNSNDTRLEIFSNILSAHLEMEVDPQPKPPVQTYSSGFFLGKHELKLEMLKRLKDKLQPNDILKTSKLEIQFCSTSTIAKSASENFLPVLVHRCPDNFSTVEYFENLNTEEIGRLVIYADLMTSSNDIVKDILLHHGLAVIPYQQTKGQGRGANMWLSPEGCAMFTLQLHIPLKSTLGQRVSLVQYLTSVAVISAVKSLPGYQDINIRLKWPNDIYTGTTKIGGVLVTSFMNSSNIICNIGLGVNLSNSSPTTCINDLIMKYNAESNSKLEKLSYEKFLAQVFSQIENLLNIIQNGNLDQFYDLYYEYWMHTNAEIKIMLPDNSSQIVQILGIDDFGFLEVKGQTGSKFTVHPDGNSFDILQGLIAPKR